MAPMHGQGDYDLVALLMVVQIVVHSFHVKGRRRLILQLSLMSRGHSHVDGESSGSEMSLDEELGIPSVVTPGARKSKNVIKTLGGDVGTHRSTRVKNHVDKLRYDGFLARHYAYMVKILEEPKPTCFKEAIGKLGGSHG